MMFPATHKLLCDDLITHKVFDLSLPTRIKLKFIRKVEQYTTLQWINTN